MQKSNVTLIVIIGLLALGGFSVLLIIGALALSDGGGFSVGGDRIAVIPVEGVIDGSMAKTVNRHLKQYGEDERVKAILLKIDSPGGGVTASEEIWREVKRVKEEKKKKVIVSMSQVAASGGYFIAAPADHIFANSSTVTGSIGVIAEWVNVKDLTDWAKVKPVVFKSGKFKDTGNPTRDLTEEERVYFQAMIDELYNQFVKVVLEGRKGRGPEGKQLDEQRVRELADGRVYTGETALANGLVDKLGNYRDALKYTADQIGMKGDPNVVTPPLERESFSILDLLGKSKVAEVLSKPSDWPSHLGNLDTSVKFKYQWK
ncbi:MAG TPA: signal peptide peptidase SppA [Blastocatellia bacterium]|nr:signal peptide peptidase SppA [Blastocatellia bacterium]